MSLPADAAIPLVWAHGDVEERLGFRGGRYTRVNNVLSFLIGCVLTIAFYAALFLGRDTYLYQMFTARGPVPYAIVLLSAWSAAILFIKSRKLAFQRRALDYPIVPSDATFVLSSATVDDVTNQILVTVDHPRQFVLFNRILIALSNLRNLGRVADVDDILRSQAEHDEAAMETSYSLIQGFVWAIPVLGFIGTVLGLSEAIASFTDVLGGATEVSQLAGALRGVTAGLATAFETTLEALVAALAIQLVLTALKKAEEEFLDACAEYCVRNIVGRLRTMPFEQEVEEA